jgi:hypothetical protein
MAPEQASGHESTVCTDVHGLGVVFYQLLTGKPPFENPQVFQLLLMIVESDPKKPREINPRLDRDLETICLKCLEKSTKKRYSTADDLAEDLQCWLDGKPIQARPVGLAERVWRWSRRNPTPAALVIAVSLLSVALVIGSVVGAVIYRETAKVAELARDRADEQRELADEQRDRAETSEHEARVEAGRDALRRGNWPEALNHYAVAIANNRPDIHRLHVERLRCWFTYRDKTKLQEELRRLAAQTDLPADLVSLINLHLGDVLISNEGQAAKARKLIQSALTGPLNAADRAYAQGLLAESSEEAMEHYRAALKIDSFHHRANSALVCEFLLTGRFEQTRQTARFLRTLYPTDPVSYFAVAWADLFEGEIQASRAQRALLRPLLDEARWKQLERYFAEMERLIATLDDWDREKIDTTQAIFRVSNSAASILGMNARSLEPIGFSAPAIERWLTAAELLQQAAAWEQLGWTSQSLKAYQQAAQSL